MTREIRRSARRASPGSSPGAALSGQGVGVRDLALDPRTGENVLRGWGWACVAAEHGVWAAATRPLGEYDEGMAHEIAQALLPDGPPAHDWVREVAEVSAEVTLDFYRIYLGRVGKLRRAHAKSDVDKLRRETDAALSDTEAWGRLAANANRIHLLISSLSKAPQ
jgi:hypothetical protein